MRIARGQTAKNPELMKRLEGSIQFLAHGAEKDNREEVRKGRLNTAGNYLAYIDILREGLDRESPEMATLNVLEKKV